MSMLPVDDGEAIVKCMFHHPGDTSHLIKPSFWDEVVASFQVVRNYSEDKEGTPTEETRFIMSFTRRVRLEG